MTTLCNSANGWRHAADPAACPRCRMAARGPAFAAVIDRQDGVAPPDTPDECPHLGAELTGPERQAVGLPHTKRWALCTHPTQPLGPYVCPCAGCGKRCTGHPAYRPPAEPRARPKPAAPKVKSAPPPLVAPLRLVPVGPAGLSARPDGYSFNASLIRYRGRLLMAYRDGWAGSNVHVAELAEDYTVLSSTNLNLRHPRAAGGREDPRLFTLGGRLHVAFIGVERAGKRVRTSQLYARLGDDLSVGAVFYPELAGRQEPMEKNWSMFDHGGELLAVYQTGPKHVVVRIDGDRAERIADTPVPFPWAGGVLRGGAPPVRVGDLYYHWFHGRVGSAKAPHYNVGLAVFEATPPFRTVAVSPRPLLWGDPVENAAHPKPCYAVVAFPCGAVLENGVWKVSMGWNDRRIMVAEWDSAAVDTALGLPRPGNPRG